LDACCRASALLARASSLMAYLLPLFFCFGILFGNLNALAMEPPGHFAGLGSALVAET
jgi:hypothetical protein